MSYRLTVLPFVPWVRGRVTRDVKAEDVGRERGQKRTLPLPVKHSTTILVNGEDELCSRLHVKKIYSEFQEILRATFLLFSLPHNFHNSSNYFFSIIVHNLVSPSIQIFPFPKEKETRKGNFSPREERKNRQDKKEKRKIRERESSN